MSDKQHEELQQINFVVPSVLKDARRLAYRRMPSEWWCVQVSDKQLEELQQISKVPDQNGVSQA